MAAVAGSGFVIGGIPIQIHRSWYVVAGLIAWSLATGSFPLRYPGQPSAVYWALGLTAALLLFTCVLLHELGHSFVARWHGIPVHRVTLFLFGGLAQIGREAHRPWVELQVALAGPAVSVLLAGACLVGLGQLPPAAGMADAARVVLHYLAMINIAIVAFNLLPGFPLDGGRVLRALLWLLTGNLPKATRIASGVGVALGIGLIILGAWEMSARGVWAGLWWVILGGYLQSVAHMTYRSSSPQPSAHSRQ